MVKYFCFSLAPPSPETEVGEEHRELGSTVRDCCLLRWVQTTPEQEWGETTLLEARLQ